MVYQACWYSPNYSTTDFCAVFRRELDPVVGPSETCLSYLQINSLEHGSFSGSSLTPLPIKRQLCAVSHTLINILCSL